MRTLKGISLSVFIRVMENHNTAERRKNHELRFNKSYEIFREIIDRYVISTAFVLNSWVILGDTMNQSLRKIQMSNFGVNRKRPETYKSNKIWFLTVIHNYNNTLKEFQNGLCFLENHFWHRKEVWIHLKSCFWISQSHNGQSNVLTHFLWIG